MFKIPAICLGKEGKLACVPPLVHRSHVSPFFSFPSLLSSYQYTSQHMHASSTPMGHQAQHENPP